MDGQKIHRSKVNSGEWVMVVTALGFMDVAQLILDFIPGVDIIVNELIDIFVGASLLLYLLLRGELKNPATRNRILIAFAITMGIEQIPLVNGFSPTWIGDGFYCWSQSAATNKSADEQEAAQKEMEIQNRLQQQRIKILGLERMRQQQYLRTGYVEENQLYDEAP